MRFSSRRWNARLASRTRKPELSASGKSTLALLDSRVLRFNRAAILSLVDKPGIPRQIILRNLCNGTGLFQLWQPVRAARGRGKVRDPEAGFRDHLRRLAAKTVAKTTSRQDQWSTHARGTAQGQARRRRPQPASCVGPAHGARL